MKTSIIFCLWFIGSFAYSQDREKTDQVDTTKTIINAYLLKENYSNLVSFEIDTGLNNLHITNPIYKNGISYSFTGNLASPYINDVFYKRDLTSDNYWMTPYSYYYSVPEEVVYYNTNKPFTRIGYVANFGSKEVSEHNVDVLHTQNFSSLNVGFRIHHLGGKGYYDRQATTNGNGNFFAHYEGIRYELLANANITNFELEQNGGIEISVFDSVEDVTIAPPNLNSADEIIKHRSFQVTQKYRLGLRLDTINIEKGSVAAFAHTIGYIQNKRTYSDVFQSGSFGGDNNDIDFYDTTFYNNTSDSAYYHNLFNQIRFEIYESDSSLLSVHGHVGLNMENINQFSTTSDTTGSFIPKKSLETSNLSLIWNLGQDKKYYYWNVNGSYYFSGYKQFDIDFNSSISFKLLDFELFGYYNFSNTEPDFLLNKYQSNHYNWDNGFKKTQINDIGAIFRNINNNFKIQINNRLATNLIYFNEEALPSQASKVANVLSIEAEKKQKLGKFVFIGKGIYQQANTLNYLSIPEWILYSSIYFDHIFHFKLTGGKLAVQLGTDVRYKSKFYAYGYNPVFEQFYLQRERMIGGYPYLSPFLNVQIKSVRFFIEYDHINQLFMKERGFLSLSGYPRNPNNIKFGIFWDFYD